MWRVGPEENGKAVVILWPLPLLYNCAPAVPPARSVEASTLQLHELLWHVYTFCEHTKFDSEEKAFSVQNATFRPGTLGVDVGRGM